VRFLPGCRAGPLGGWGNKKKRGYRDSGSGSREARPGQEGAAAWPHTVSTAGAVMAHGMGELGSAASPCSIRDPAVSVLLLPLPPRAPKRPRIMDRTAMG